MKLFVDDIRPAMPGWMIVTNYQMAINFLSTMKVDIISLDHDLGEEKTGYDIAKWIEEKVATDPSYNPPHIIVHSANPVGCENIMRCINSIVRLLKERES